MTPSAACWCGNQDLLSFSESYLRCPSCHTLVSSKIKKSPGENAHGEEKDLYGQRYWFAHQTEDLNQPDILARSRLDLTERCLHWLGTTLKYKLPPGATLELGCAHGAFVALLQWVGFHATGLEMDPWIVEFGRKTFQVPILLGPIEKQSLTPRSLDVIFLLDVLEHLPDPEGTLRRCLSLLREGGIFILQTPCFPEAMTHEDLKTHQHRFLGMMIPDEHLYLFSRPSLGELFRRLGMAHLQFEPAIFAHYDMFLCAGQTAFSTHSPEEVAQVLSASVRGRMVLALLDMHQNLKRLTERYAESEAHRTARLEVNGHIRKQLETFGSVLEALRRGKVFRTLRKVGLWKKMEEMMLEALSPLDQGNAIALPFKTCEKTMAGQAVTLKRIAVDLTPMLPGGENGGAKLLSLELVRHLSRLHPECEFILLTSSSTHDEIAHLDSANVRRLCVRQVASASSAPEALRWKRLRIRLREFLIGALPSTVLLPLKKIYRSAHFRRISSPGLLRNLDIDLLFCPFTLPIYYEPSLPVVSIIYDLQYRYYPQFFDFEDREVRERNFREACRRADRLVCISDYVRRSVLENSNKAPEHVRSIPIRLQNRLKKPPRERIQPFLSQQGLRENEFFLYPANFWPHKNHPMLLTAFGLFLSRHPDSALRLVCTGTPDARMAYLQEAAFRMGLDKWVLFPGFLTEEDFSILLAACLALIFPSLYEGFGMPVLEAMAFGKPVLCSNVTSLPEVAGEAALFFDPRRPEDIYQAMRRIFYESLLYSKLAEMGYQHTSRWGDASQMAREYWKAFQDAASGKLKFSEAIHGVYPDGWTQDRMFVAYGPSSDKRKLEVVFELPTFLPKRDISVTVFDRMKNPLKRQSLQWGKRKTIRHSLPESSGVLEFSFYPTFVPKDYGLNQDKRVLGCLCRKCIIHLGRKAQSLFPYLASKA